MAEERTSRLFTWEDIPGVHDLISSAWGYLGARSYLHIGDFYWSIRPSKQFDPERDVRLWRVRGELAAFAWFDGPASGEVVVRPGAPDELELEAIAWLETQQRRSDEPGQFTIAAIDDDVHRTTILAKCGYVRGDDGGQRFHQGIIGAPDRAALPDGFTVRSVSSDDDIGRRVFAQRTSFEQSSATVDVWRGLRQLPGYRPTLDLIVVAPDGTGAAGCTCWYDEANQAGEFEPVGTSRAFQRMGIGKALVTDGLRRLRKIGARQAIVQTNSTNAAAIALYRSCGFELAATQHNWTKKL
jgi:mycothiol synthase